MRASGSLASIFGVVPDETSAWKPEIAPHAIVMNANGKTLPANTGPEPSVNCVSAGMCSGGSEMMMPSASAMTTPIFTKAER